MISYVRQVSCTGVKEVVEVGVLMENMKQCRIWNTQNGVCH